jgi:predicted metal-binding membrane protein
MTVAVDRTLETVIRRDRTVVIAGLVTVVAVSWVYLFAGAGMGMSGLEMTRMSQLELAGDMHHMAMMKPATWTPGYAALMFLMWWVMMVAMMLPSAAPMILLFATVNRRQSESGHVATGIFALGYLAAWAGFSLAGVILQWMLEHAGILSSMLVSNNAFFGGGLLIAAGIYQLTPIKQACLRHCRSPQAFVGRHWRPGAGGALRMGLLHGAFCVACCAFLMVLMFIGGLMNLYWIAGLALFVLFEKTAPANDLLDNSIGVVLLAWGGWMLLPAATAIL